MRVWSAFLFRAKREQIESFSGLLPESQGQYLAIYMPYSFDSGGLETPERSSSAASTDHTVDYDPVSKSQLAST